MLLVQYKICERSGRMPLIHIQWKERFIGKRRQRHEERKEGTEENGHRKL
jgi:hypothetical protein